MSNNEKYHLTTYQLLLHQLQCTESIIYRLFTFDSFSIDLLKEKLCQLEHLVAQIPLQAECAEMVKKWRTKLVEFWDRFAVKMNIEELCRLRRKLTILELLITRLIYDKSTSGPLLERALMDLAQSILCIPCELTTLRRLWTDKLVQLWTTCGRLQQQQQQSKGSHKEAEFSETSTSAQPGLDAVYLDEQKQTLNWLPAVTSATDLDSLASLTVIVSQIRDYLDKGHSMSSQLNRDLFNLAFRKLPTSLQKQFLIKYGTKSEVNRWTNYMAFLRYLICSN